MKFLLTYLFLVSVVVSGQEKITLTKLTKSELPKEITYKGNLKEAVRWMDESGVNLVVTSETEEAVSKSAPSEDYREKYLFAHHYLLFEDSISQTWKVTDFTKECPLDLAADFVKNIQVTDLDKDGMGEVWLMYIVTCKGDVSPAEMKIILYEGTQKFALRGHNQVDIGNGQLEGGDYKFDKAFNQGPEVFRDFAKKLWKANIRAKWY
ncbi:hypothetical protein [Fluviicola sp.]|uniref:M949_RS01915 family surface polysaccharide biosynthesis protein n=1 Tax=Fluviicola sp. TaxID=1917219 RepID=UPI0031D88348